MKAPKPLSATMVACIDDAAAAGGELVRFQGGYWAARNEPRDHRGIPRQYHGTPTIGAIVRRGEAEYTEWHNAGRSPDSVRIRCFPIAIKLTPIHQPNGGEPAKLRSVGA